MDDLYPIIGMSPGNSYFKDDEIRYLLATVVEKYGRAAILIADIPAISTYIALGYTPNRARRDKALPKGNSLRNRTRRIAEELGLTEQQVRIIHWESEVETNKNYRESFKKTEDLYRSNIRFQESANDTTRNVLVTSNKEIVDLDAATKTAVHYLLSEIAFLEFAPTFLQSKRIGYVYHKNWAIFEDFIAGKFDGKPKLSMEFILIENPYETYHAMWADEGDVGWNTLENIQRNGVLRAAFFPYPPALYFDKEQNIFSGIFYDVIGVIAEKYGWNIRWQEETGYGVILDGLREGRFDIFASTVWPTSNRKEEADFSVSLYQSKVYSWKKEGASDPASPLRIAVKEGDITDSIATEDFPNARHIQVPQLSSVYEVLNVVANGKADITFAEAYLVERFNETAETKLYKYSSEPIRTYENTFMMRKDDIEFKTILDKEIEHLISTGFIRSLIEKYTGNPGTFT